MIHNTIKKNPPHRNTLAIGEKCRFFKKINAADYASGRQFEAALGELPEPE